MAAIYSIENPDDSRSYHANKAEALGLGKSRSIALHATVIVRAHVMQEMAVRELACQLLNGNGFNVDGEIVIGWFSKGYRHRTLEGRK